MADDVVAALGRIRALGGDELTEVAHDLHHRVEGARAVGILLLGDVQDLVLPHHEIVEFVDGQSHDLEEDRGREDGRELGVEVAGTGGSDPLDQFDREGAMSTLKLLDSLG